MTWSDAFAWTWILIIAVGLCGIIYAKWNFFKYLFAFILGAAAIATVIKYIIGPLFNSN